MSEALITVMLFCSAFLFVIATVCSALLTSYIVLCLLAPAIWRKIISLCTKRGR